MTRLQTPELVQNVDQYFDDKRIKEQRQDYYVDGTDLPYLVRPVIEAIHDLQPDAVIAADRGGRPIGFAIIAGWRQRFPGVRFPTSDESVHFARVSSRSVERTGAEDAVKTALLRGQIIDNQDSRKAPKGTKLVFVDDWVYDGGTTRIFEEIAEDMGVKAKNRLLYTMLGKQKHDRHIVGDSRRIIGCRWNNDSYISGVTYPDYGIKARAHSTYESRNLRREILISTDGYYSRFRTAYTQRLNARTSIRSSQ